MRNGFFLAIVIGLTTITGASAQLLRDDDPELNRIDVVEHLGGGLPLQMLFTGRDGVSVELGRFFDGEIPVVMVLYYSDCPMLCSLVLNGLCKALPAVPLQLGDHYRLVTVSINPEEGSAHSQAAYERYFPALPAGSPPEAWHFLTGDSLAIAALADSLGFRFFKVDKTGEYAHPAVVMILTPDGRVSRYLYGIEYKPQDLRLALLEAAQGRVGDTIDRILLYCFHYDPDAKGYVLFAGNVMKLGGLVSLVLLGVVLAILWNGERKKSTFK